MSTQALSSGEKKKNLRKLLMKEKNNPFEQMKGED